MRHLNQGRKLNRTGAHRKALFRNLVLALIKSGRITTTDAKAKELGVTRTGWSRSASAAT